MDCPVTQDQRHHLLLTGDPNACRAGGGPALMPPTDRLPPTRQTWVPWSSGVSNPWPAPRLWALPVCADLPRMCQDHSCRLIGTREREKAPILLSKQAEKPHQTAQGHTDIQGHSVSLRHMTRYLLCSKMAGYLQVPRLP